MYEARHARSCRPACAKLRRRGAAMYCSTVTQDAAGIARYHERHFDPECTRHE
jgi:hypothetical protein